MISIKYFFSHTCQRHTIRKTKKELLKKKLVLGIKIFPKNEKSKSLNRLMKYMKNLSKEEKEKTAAKHRKNYYMTHKE